MKNAWVMFSPNELGMLNEWAREGLQAISRATSDKHQALALVVAAKISAASKKAGVYTEVFEGIPAWMEERVLNALLPRPEPPKAKPKPKPKARRVRKAPAVKPAEPAEPATPVAAEAGI